MHIDIYLFCYHIGITLISHFSLSCFATTSDNTITLSSKHQTATITHIWLRGCESYECCILWAYLTSFLGFLLGHSPNPDSSLKWIWSAKKFKFLYILFFFFLNMFTSIFLFWYRASAQRITEISFKVMTLPFSKWFINWTHTVTSQVTDWSHMLLFSN